MSAREQYKRGMEVVIRSDRGVEVGQVLCESTEDALSHLDQPPAGTIVRAVDQEDAASLDSIEGARLKEIKSCQRHVAKLEMKMKLVEVERLLGGQRMVVYYVAEERVDFRELVKLLAAEFQTRIEMRQVGVRDEAKILADYGDCGKPVCCNNHLVKMPPVSMKMAKLQKATLDPTKISGRCGRLKCCLRYEFDTYEEIQRQLPSVGWQIVTRDGKARVIAQQILAQQLLVETEDHRRMLIDASEVLSVIKKSAPQRSQRAAVKGSEVSDTTQQTSKVAEEKQRRGSKSNQGPKKSSGNNSNSSDAKTPKNKQAPTSDSISEVSPTKKRRPRGKKRKPPNPSKDQ